MSDQPLNDFGKTFFESLDRRDLDAHVKFYASDAKFYGFGPEGLNPNGVKGAMTEFFTAFPDSRMPVDDIIAEGDRVAIRHTFRGTHQAPFQGIPATGRSVVVTGITTLRVKNGKVVEGWLHADMFGLLQQLGVVPQSA